MTFQWRQTEDDDADSISPGEKVKLEDRTTFIAYEVNVRQSEGIMYLLSKLNQLNECLLQPATEETSELYAMFKSALKTGDKQQLQSVLDQLDISRMLDKGTRQAGNKRNPNTNFRP